MQAMAMAMAGAGPATARSGSAAVAADGVTTAKSARERDGLPEFGSTLLAKLGAAALYPQAQGNAAELSAQAQTNWEEASQTAAVKQQRVQQSEFDGRTLREPIAEPDIVPATAVQSQPNRNQPVTGLGRGLSVAVASDRSRKSLESGVSLSQSEAALHRSPAAVKSGADSRVAAGNRATTGSHGPSATEDTAAASSPPAPLQPAAPTGGQPIPVPAACWTSIPAPALFPPASPSSSSPLSLTLSLARSGSGSSLATLSGANLHALTSAAVEGDEWSGQTAEGLRSGANARTSGLTAQSMPSEVVNQSGGNGSRPSLASLGSSGESALPLSATELLAGGHSFLGDSPTGAIPTERSRGLEASLSSAATATSEANGASTVGMSALGQLTQAAKAGGQGGSSPVPAVSSSNAAGDVLPEAVTSTALQEKGVLAQPWVKAGRATGEVAESGSKAESEEGSLRAAASPSGSGGSLGAGLPPGSATRSAPAADFAALAPAASIFISEPLAPQRQAGRPQEPSSGIHRASTSAGAATPSAGSLNLVPAGTIPGLHGAVGDGANGRLATEGRGSTPASRDLFSEIDRSGSPAPAALTGNSRMVAVGVEDPAHGWLEVRAGGSSGQVTASLNAASPEAHAALHAQLAGMSAYLAEHDIGLRSLEITSHAGGGSSHLAGGDTGQGAPAGAQSGEGQGSAGRGGGGFGDSSGRSSSEGSRQAEPVEGMLTKQSSSAAGDLPSSAVVANAPRSPHLISVRV